MSPKRFTCWLISDRRSASPAEALASFKQEITAVFHCIYRSGLALSAVALVLAVGMPRASAETEMEKKIAEVRKRLDAERSLPDDQRWTMDEQQLEELEAKAAKGDQQAISFLEITQVRTKNARRERLQKKWGRVLNMPEAPAELRTHALRVAELKRIRSQAIARHFPAYAQRANELLKAEAERHEQRMNEIAAELRGGAAAPGATAPAAEAPAQQVAGAK